MRKSLFKHLANRGIQVQSNRHHYYYHHNCYCHHFLAPSANRFSMSWPISRVSRAPVTSLFPLSSPLRTIDTECLGQGANIGVPIQLDFSGVSLFYWSIMGFWMISGQWLAYPTKMGRPSSDRLRACKLTFKVKRGISKETCSNSVIS